LYPDKEHAVFIICAASGSGGTEVSVEYNGIAGSGGIVIGRSYIYKKEKIIIDRNTIYENYLNEELHKVDEALILTKDQINKIKE
ncbi:hypothetical protein NPM20_24355, partial [Vibrio parahaemolyticus]|uniref:phosphoenolpyruvate-utilizing N-terminal domain-containing protein n=1 Tax=Vibrio parahaemolyticus TaxID=670 RepID=UPI002113370D